MLETVLADEMATAETREENVFYTVKDVIFKEKIYYELVKRFFDIIASFIALIIAIIPMLIISFIISIESDGGAIYAQERLGKGGKPFILYKFRTMYTDAEKNGAQWASKNDDRCTKFGAFLRKTRMDELMQLINILKGDMSIVGPRPERKIFYNKFSTYIDGFDKRLLVKPGLTGLAQVNGGYDLKPYEKIVLDIEYIEKRNMWLDIKIIFKTVSIVFNHNGAR